MKRTAGSETGARPAVFLDRDGTVIEERNYLAHSDQLTLIPGASAALRDLRAAGYALVLVTNQSGVARGLLDEARLAQIHGELERRLAAEGVTLDGIYYCPHHPSVGPPKYRRDCACRKPAPGMLRRALDELPLVHEGSLVIGDSLRDLEAGAALDMPGYLVRTGKGAAEEQRLPPGSGFTVVDDLARAARRILGT